jgi:hypothetical protein
MRVARRCHSHLPDDSLGWSWTDFGGGLFDERPITQAEFGTFSFFGLDMLIWSGAIFTCSVDFNST